MWHRRRHRARGGLRVYHFLALRRFFGESWARTLWKGTLITIMYLVLVAVAIGLLLWIAVRGLGGG